MPDYPLLNKQKKYIDACTTCGICHTVCPSYKMSDRELLSPRGRIMILRRLMAGDISPMEISTDTFDFCTLCYACQTACPSGVKTDEMFIAARQELASFNGINRVKKIIFNALESPAKVNLFVSLGSLGQKVLGKKNLENIAGGMQIPELRSKPFMSSLPDIVEARGEKKFRVGFFLGCISNYVDESAAVAAIEVLSRLGCEVVIPHKQVCCGAPAFNNGDFEIARKLAIKNLRLFEASEVDFMVSADATCGGAFQHEYLSLLDSEDDETVFLAHNTALKTMDWTTFILEKLDPEFENKKLPEIKVTIHNSCHQINTRDNKYGIADLVKKLPNVEIIKLEEDNICCGFGGSFASIYPDEANEWTQRKIDNILKTTAPVVLAASPGCISQMKGGLAEKRNRVVNIKHPAEFIVERMNWR